MLRRRKIVQQKKLDPYSCLGVFNGITKTQSVSFSFFSYLKYYFSCRSITILRLQLLFWDYNSAYIYSIITFDGTSHGVSSTLQLIQTNKAGVLRKYSTLNLNLKEVYVQFEIITYTLSTSLFSLLSSKGQQKIFVILNKFLLYSYEFIAD